MSTPLVFDDLTLREVPVSLGGQSYILREGNGTVCAKFRSIASAGLKFRGGTNSDKPEISSVSGVGELAIALVQMCLFKVLPTGGTEPCEEVFIRKLPGRVIDTLFEQAKEMSNLNEKKVQTKPDQDQEKTPGE